MNKRNILITILGIILLTNGYPQDYWQLISTVPDSTFSRCINISPEGNIYLGMCGFDYPGGIYRSTDNAQTWEYLGLTEKPVYTIEICSNGDILAGVFSGIYKSTDNGETWYEVNFGIGNITNILSVSNGYVFAGLNGNINSIIRSINFGETWEDTVLFFTNYGDEYLESITRSPEGFIYVGTYNMFGTSGIYRSIDMGNNWEPVDFPGEDVYSIGVHPNGDIFAGCLGDGLYRYYQNTGQWTHELYNVTPDDILFVGNDIIYLGCNGQPLTMPGILYSDDGGQNYNWLNSGINGGNGISINYLIRHPNCYVYTEGLGFYRSVEPVFTGLNNHAGTEIIITSNYPNPFRDKTVIRWDNSDKDKYVNLVVLIATGKIIMNRKIMNTGSYIFKNDFLESGIFFYSIVGKNNIYSGRMVFVK